MKTVTLHIDGSIPIVDISRALAAIGYTLSSDANGEMRVSKRRIRARPALAVVEGKEPEKK
jgi:hypothetical protein